jgi:hypothetical protein
VPRQEQADGCHDEVGDRDGQQHAGAVGLRGEAEQAEGPSEGEQRRTLPCRSLTSRGG